MKKTFLISALSIILFVSFSNTSYADLQCYSSPSSFVNVQNAAQCSSYNPNGVLLDTATQKWTDPRTGAATQAPGAPVSTQTAQGIVSCVTSGAGSYDQCAQMYNYKGSAADVQSAAITPATVPLGTSQPGATGANLGYTPLEPIPGITSGFDVTNPKNLPVLINAIFRVLFTIGALIAVLSLTIGGIQYMVSEAIHNKKDGLARAQAALWGMLVLAGAWLILYTINPQLLQFNLNPCPPGSSNCVINAAPAVTSSGSSIQTTQVSAATAQQLGLQNTSVLIYDNSSAAANNTAISNAISSCQQQLGSSNDISATQVGGTSNQTAVVCEKPSYWQAVGSALAR